MTEEPGRSFDGYVTARWSRLVRSAVMMGADLHTAEDLVQTALSRCYFKWDKVVRAGDLDAYVHRVLINVLRDSRRRRSSTERPSKYLPDRPTADRTGEVDTSYTLLTALASLSSAHREVVVLRFYADFTEAQTADALGLPLGTVKSRTARALAALAASPHLDTAERGRPS